MRAVPAILQSRPRGTGYRLASGVRLFLCGLILLFTFSDEGQRANISPVAAAMVIVYTGYSVFLFFIGRQEIAFWRFFKQYGSWIDIACCGILSLSTGGHSSPFNFLLFFAIIDGTSSQGFAAGMKITTAVVALWVGISLLTMRSSEMLAGIFASAPLMFLIGFIIAFRGGREFSIKRKLSLIQQIGAVATPQIGLVRSMGISLELLRNYFDSEDCFLVIRDEETKERFFYKALRTDSARPDETELSGVQNVPDETFVERLLAVPPAVAVMYSDRSPWRKEPRTECVALGASEKYLATEPDHDCRTVAEILDTKVYMSVPVTFGRRPAGRLYLVRSDKWKRFREADIEIAVQIVNQLTPLIENARLIDRISSNAAEEERKRIARDIHDSIIQPYLGIKLGLESVDVLLEENADAGKVRERIRSLEELTDITIENLRGLVRGLADSRTSGGTLLPSVRRFAEKFSGATGINVEIESFGDLKSADQLAPDVFQLAVEGLSNIRKHTQSSKALVTIGTGEKKLNLRITNDNADGTVFRPRSITERVAALNGTVDIKRGDGKCTVSIEIPL